MYKVFLVEDEEHIRARIRDNFDWAGHNLQLGGEASDGELALPLITETEPDILMTDIRMPFLNGLELSRLIRKKMPWVKIIIISGHDDFNYAQDAISIGVSEYVLKPVKPSQLSEVLNKTVQSLEEEEKEISRLEEYEKKVKEGLSLQKEKFLLEMITYGVDPSSLFARADYFDIPLRAKHYAVMIVQFTPSKDLVSDKQYMEILKLNRIIVQITESYGDFLSTAKNLNETLFVLTAASVEELEEKMSLASNKLKMQCEQLLQGNLRIGQGNICSRISELPISYKGAEKALEYNFLFQAREVMSEEDVAHFPLLESGLLDLKSETLLNFMKYNRIEDIDGFIEEYLTLLKQSRYRGKFLVRFVYFFILLSAGRFVESLKGDPEEVLSSLSTLDEDLLEMEDTSYFKEKVRQVLSRIIEFRSTRNFSKYGKPIERAKDYIRENFAKTDISLQEVADVANFSSCRFSTIFKQETGETFSNFLTKTRIEKAMEYLKTSSMQSMEISRLVGYNDSHYFSYIFKKVSGVSPTQFRDQIG